MRWGNRTSWSPGQCCVSQSAFGTHAECQQTTRRNQSYRNSAGQWQPVCRKAVGKQFIHVSVNAFKTVNSKRCTVLIMCLTMRFFHVTILALQLFNPLVQISKFQISVCFPVENVWRIQWTLFLAVETLHWNWKCVNLFVVDHPNNKRWLQHSPFKFCSYFIRKLCKI